MELRCIFQVNCEMIDLDYGGLSGEKQQQLEELEELATLRGALDDMLFAASKM